MRVLSFMPFLGLSLVSAMPSFIEKRDLKIDPSKLPANWTYSGCYTDQRENRTLGLGYMADAKMTSAKCIKYCSGKGFSYAGTQYGQECYCGYQLTASVKAADSECNVACPGAKTEPCGGADRLTVFTNGVAPPAENPGPSGWSSLGCYTDNQSARALELYLPAASVSVGQCTTECSRRGYLYAGVEFGQECYCGNSIKNKAAPATSGCNLPCSGNKTELCGGTARLNLYRRAGSTSTTTTMKTSTSTTMKPTSTSVMTTTTSTTATTTTTTSRVVGTLAPLDDVTVYTGNSSYTASGVLYARSLQLPDGTLIVTSEEYAPEPPIVSYPIYKSFDYGRTWTKVSAIVDTYRKMGGRYQPSFFLLPERVGNYAAGTILFCGNFIPTDLSSTHLDVYASTDAGMTWTFVSSVATGGAAQPWNGPTPVWEPLFVYEGGKLGVFYSDQRDPLHGQKVCHQVTTDLMNWGAVVNDVAYSDYNMRPGMPAVAQMKNGKWILAYEWVGEPSGNAPVYVKIADSPWTFLDSPGVAVLANGRRPQSSPSVVVLDTGRVLLSGGQSKDLFISDTNGSENGWRTFTTPQPSGYARWLEIVKEPAKAKQWLMLTSGGWFNNQPTNRVSAGILDPATI